MSELTADQEKLFAIRTENQLLMDRIATLETTLTYLKKLKKSGRIRISVDQLLNDLKFMKEGGDTYIDLIYHDDKFVRLDPIELINVH